MKEVKTLEEFNSFINENKENNSVEIAVFSTQFCGPCKALTPTLEAISEEMGINIIKVYIDEDELSDLVGEYGIRTVPVIIYFKNGEILEKTVGLKTKTEIIEIIEKYRK